MHSRTQARLIYVSQPTTGLDPAMVDEMLGDARENNQRLRITGMLINTGNAYIHCLEGEHAAITELYVRISNDARNRDARMVSIEVAPYRHFEQPMDYLDGRIPGATFAALEAVRHTDPRRLERDQARDLFNAVARSETRSAA